MSSPRQNLVQRHSHRCASSTSIESDMLAAMSANRRANDRPRRSGAYTLPCFRATQFGVTNAPARVRRVHPSHLLFPPSPTSFRTSTPQPTLREPFVLSSMQPELEPEPTRNVAVEPLPESRALARRRSTRCCRTGNTSSVGDMSITGTGW
jgi:hypothetical protein